MVLPNSKYAGIAIGAFFGVAVAPQGAPSGRGLSASQAESAENALAGRAPDTPPVPSGPCSQGMVLVSGEYCPEPNQRCKAWMDPPPYQNLRCAEYETPATCSKPRVSKSFCIDKEEHTEPGESLPTVNVSFIEAKAACEKEGKHLCKEDEWQFACEGEEMRPYPYGFARDSTACNIDQTNLGSMGKGLRDLRAPNTAYDRCLSPFGAHNMTGNVDEWVDRDGPHRSVLHGGWWLPGRNRCRATTAEHGPEYTAKQVGYRCCKDATLP